MATLDTLRRVGPRKLKWMLGIVLSAGLVPFIAGSPGIGKSSIVAQIAKEKNLKLIDHRLSTSIPEDMSGLAFQKDGEAHFLPFAGIFPTVGTPLPEGFDGWILFLDEFNSADKDVQKAAYKLILDRMVGQHHLHPNVHIVCAGNLITDRAFVTEQSTAMQSRVIHFELHCVFKEWFEDVAIPRNYDSRILAFLSRHEDKLMTFKPNHNDHTFCCPRTWDFVDRLVKASGDTKVLDIDTLPMYTGAISAGVAVEFVQFTAVYDRLVSKADILNGTAVVPTELDLKWATMSMMANIIDPANKDSLEKIVVFANKFDVAMRVLFFRTALARFPLLRREPIFISSLGSLQNHM